jgi:hypothetical protein
MHISPTSYHFVPLRSKHFLQHPILEHLSLGSYLNARD